MTDVVSIRRVANANESRYLIIHEDLPGIHAALRVSAVHGDDIRRVESDIQRRLQWYEETMTDVR